jgi:hypothetical protein
MSTPPPAESPSGYASRSSSKRTSSSPQLLENAKLLALALAQNPAPAIPSITQPAEDMDWEKVTTDPAKQHPAPAPNRAPAPSPSLPAEATAYNEDEDAEIETMYSDYPIDDLKPTADITVTKHTTDQLEYDDEGDEEDDDDAGPGNDVPTQHTEYKVPKNTKPNSLCRYIADHLAHNGAPTLASAAQHIETWTAVLQNEDILLTSLGKMSGPSAPHPVLFLALDAATSTALLLHHFGIVSTGAHQRGGRTSPPSAWIASTRTPLLRWCTRQPPTGAAT